jgi:hypothetical protein
MTTIPHTNPFRDRATLFSPSNQASTVHIRLRVYPSSVHSPTDILSELMSNYGVWCQFNPGVSRNNRSNQSIDLELRGTIAQVCCGLRYLESLNLRIVSKASTSGDGWHV